MFNNNVLNVVLHVNYAFLIAGQYSKLIRDIN